MLGILVAGAWHREYISFRLREAYWFSRCMNHVTPPGTVRLEFDSTKAKALIDQNPEYFEVNTYVLRTPKGSSPPIQIVVLSSHNTFQEKFANWNGLYY